MPQLFRYFVLIVPLAWAPLSYPGAREGGDLLGNTSSHWRVVCERALSESNAEFSNRRLSEDVFGRPFVSFVIHDMTKAGFAKLGIDLDVEKIKNLVFVANRTPDQNVVAELHLYKDGNFSKVFSYQFINPVLTGWDAIKLYEDQDKMSYEELISRIPSRRTDWVGYHSVPDKNDIRFFLTFSEGHGEVSEHATFGLDIPCDKIKKYTNDIVEVVDDLRSPDGKRCRVSVLSFIRTE